MNKAQAYAKLRGDFDYLRISLFDKQPHIPYLSYDVANHISFSVLDPRL